MRNISDVRCRENQNPYFIFNNFVSENLVVNKIIRKNMVQPNGSQITIKYSACCIPKAKDACIE